AISIQNGNCTTREIGIDIGKDHSTVSRYLAEMGREEKWGIKRDINGNIVISLKKQIEQQYQELDNEPFNQLPSIQKWITFLKSGAIPASRINHLVNVIHGISDQLKIMPETLVSYGVPIDSTKRKEIAIEYWQNFLAWFNTAYPQMQKTNTINAYRSFLAAHNINFAHGEGKRYGLSTTPERLGEYKDIMLTPDQIDKINRKLENEKDWEAWSFMNIDLHTGARAFAMASMSWDKIAFSPLFRVEQFESKTKRGDWYLAKEGKWWVKYPTEECRAIVETAYDRLPKNRRFLFFKDAKSDKANALQASYFMSKMAIKFKRIFAEPDGALPACLHGPHLLQRGRLWHELSGEQHGKHARGLGWQDRKRLWRIRAYGRLRGLQDRPLRHTASAGGFPAVCNARARHAGHF
ncbi:MAG TPA: hypothetical protein VF172_11440, partial [Nitrososphaera sp.]